MTSLRDKVVFITGGARGIGAEVARRLNAKGARLVLTDLNDAELTSLAAELGEERVLTAVADVRDLSAMQAAADRAVERFGGIDVVLANAGIASYGSVAQVDPDAFRRVLDINVLGVFHTVRATLPAVIERRGYVLIVSSLAAYAACPGWPLQRVEGRRRDAGQRAATGSGPARRQGRLGAHVLDQHRVGSRHPERPAGLRSTARQPALAAEQDDDGRQMRGRVRQGHPAPPHRIYCPRWVALFRWAKPVLSSRLGEMPLHSPTAELLPALDAQVAALGRSMSAANVELLRPDRGSARN